MQFISIETMDMVLSCATIPAQSGPWSNGNEGVLHISQNSSITGTSPSDFFSAIYRTLIGGGYHSTAVQSVYSTVPADWTNHVGKLYQVRTNAMSDFILYIINEKKKPIEIFKLSKFLR